VAELTIIIKQEMAEHLVLALTYQQVEAKALGVLAATQAEDRELDQAEILICTEAVAQAIRTTVEDTEVLVTLVEETLEFTTVDRNHQIVKDKQHQELVVQVHHKHVDVEQVGNPVW
jgi:Na+-transporting NADH:ubiquinone oxidoreductase subunit NqrC